MNQIREAWGRIENLAATVGESILPVFGDVIVQINTLVAALTDAWKDDHQAIINWAIGSTDGTSLARMGVLSLMSVVRTLADTWQVVRLGIQAVQLEDMAALGSLVFMMRPILEAFDRLAKYITGISTGLGEFAKNWSEELAKEAGNELANLRKDFAKPWASEGIDQAILAEKEKIDKLRGELSGPTSLKGSNEAGEKPGKAHKAFGAATTMGSTEAASIILSSKYGDKADNSQRELVASSKRQEDLLAQIARASSQLASGQGAGGLASFGVI
jgi:hypothetical protein